MRTDIGKYVIYVDTLGKERPALVTNKWTNGQSPDGVNVAFVNDDDKQTDTFGRKIERASSVCHASVQTAHGNYWRNVDETR